MVITRIHASLFLTERGVTNTLFWKLLCDILVLLVQIIVYPSHSIRAKFKLYYH